MGESLGSQGHARLAENRGHHTFSSRKLQENRAQKPHPSAQEANVNICPTREHGHHPTAISVTTYAPHPKLYLSAHPLPPPFRAWGSRGFQGKGGSHPSPYSGLLTAARHGCARGRARARNEVGINQVPAGLITILNGDFCGFKGPKDFYYLTVKSHETHILPSGIYRQNYRCSVRTTQESDLINMTLTHICVLNNAFTL